MEINKLNMIESVINLKNLHLKEAQKQYKAKFILVTPENRSP